MLLSTAEFHAVVPQQRSALTNGGTTSIEIPQPAALLGVGSNCLSLPEWISVASWQQDQKGAPLPCNNLTSFPYEQRAVRMGPHRAALTVLPHIDFWSHKKPAGTIGCRGGTYCHQLYMSPFWAEIFATVRGGAPLPKEASGRIPTLEEAAGWTDSTQPLSQYAILRRHSMRTYAKLQLLLLVALFAQGTHWRNYGLGCGSKGRMRMSRCCSSKAPPCSYT